MATGSASIANAATAPGLPSGATTPSSASSTSSPSSASSTRWIVSTSVSGSRAPLRLLLKTVPEFHRQATDLHQGPASTVDDVELADVVWIFGPAIADGAAKDEVERLLLFMSEEMWRYVKELKDAE